MSERKLATVRRIDNIEPIPGADKIVKATVGGWQLVTAIDNGFKTGDLVVYLEIDSWVPHTIAPFLSKGQYPRVFNGVEGERLKTIKLRGQVSQGLLLPLSILEGKIEDHWLAMPDMDVTEVLGIQKWEKPLSAQLAGTARGNFPSFIFKTDQERIQNMTREFEKYKAEGLTFEVTEKLEGSSMTVYHRKTGEIVGGEPAIEIETGVCSRNLNLKETEENAFWKAARQYGLIEKLTAYGKNIALQGELIGEGVQGNIYGIKGLQFRLFDVFDIDTATYYNWEQRLKLASELGIEFAPVVGLNTTLSQFETVQDLLAYAEGASNLANTEREGLVFKCLQNPAISFKAISNKYLLNGGE